MKKFQDYLKEVDYKSFSNRPEPIIKWYVYEKVKSLVYMIKSLPKYKFTKRLYLTKKKLKNLINYKKKNIA